MASDIVGIIIGTRYQVTSYLGSGGFGDVVAARDTLKGRQVAIKSILPGGEVLAQREIAHLKKLGEHNPEENFCLRLLGNFIFKDQVFMVFPLLGKSVREFVRMAAVGGRRAFTDEQVKHIAHQLLSAVKFVHDHDMVHCDLKTQNIVFVDSTYKTDKKTGQLSIIRTDIRLIDFGLTRSIEGRRKFGGISGTVKYFSPEMALGLFWSKPIDIWAVGYIIAELILDRSLFITTKRLVLLGMMERIVGNLPEDMILESPSKDDDFTPEGRVKLSDYQSMSFRRMFKPLQRELFPDESPGGVNWMLYKLVTKLLRYRPGERLTADEALAEHYFVSLPEEKKKPTKWFRRFKWW